MKKYIFFFIALLILSNRSFANNPSNAEETQQLILNELRIIKEIQDSTYKQRMKAAEARKKASKDPSTTLPAEYSVLTGIETNTRSNFLYDSWNSYGIIALLFSICALFFTGKQYFSQKQTEMNTRESEKHSKNAPISVQLGKLEDLPRHFYRNLVCSGAIIFKHKHTSNGSSGNRNNYPSESNFRKLQTLPDDIFLPIDIEEESYKMMHELRLLFRNYNMEVLVASEHVSRRNLTDKSLENDFDNMLFKPFHLTKEALPYEKLLKPEVINQNKNTVDTIIFEHFKKLHTNITTLMRKDQSSYLKDLLNQKPDDNSGYIKTIIDEKGAIARSMKTFAEVKGSKKDIMNPFEQ